MMWEFPKNRAPIQDPPVSRTLITTTPTKGILSSWKLRVLGASGSWRVPSCVHRDGVQRAGAAMLDFPKGPDTSLKAGISRPQPTLEQSLNIATVSVLYPQ